jgi:hypothetical protein
MADKAFVDDIHVAMSMINFFHCSYLMAAIEGQLEMKTFEMIER